uniref:Oligosaccharyltransferase complex subunit n=1 Tax=Castor canadensis TaxID=51338 RepID=A0A8C0XJN7_CASCN
METLYHVQVIMSQLKLRKPPWVHMPLALTVYALIHFLPHHRMNDVDVIVERPSVDSMTDEQGGPQQPVAFLTYRKSRETGYVLLMKS